jgi:ribosomal protein S18 acetylase RimI-like enzyme
VAQSERVPNTLLVRSADASPLPPTTAQPGIRSLAVAELPLIAPAYVAGYAGTVVSFTPAEGEADVAATGAGEYGVYQPEHSAIAESTIRANPRLRRPGSADSHESRQCVGAIIVVRDAPYPDVPRGLFILDLFVVPDRRGRGLGRALLLHAVRRAAAETISLRVDVGNAPALALYRSLGFTAHAPQG